MSDDSVELGGFGPTTPAHPVPKLRSRSRAGQQPTIKPIKLVEKMNVGRTGANDREPGTSKRTAGGGGTGGGGGGGRPAKRRKEVEEVEEVLLDDDNNGGGDGNGDEDEEVVMPADAVVVSSDDGERRVEEVEPKRKVGNGRQKNQLNGQGRAKGKQQKPSKVMEVHGSEEEENREGFVHAGEAPARMKTVERNGLGGAKAAVKREKGTTSGAGMRAKGGTDLYEGSKGSDEVTAFLDRMERSGAAATAGGNAKPDSKKDAELARLREKVSRLEKENETLSNQMEELFRVRETEAEALMQKSVAQYEARIRALEDVNQALTEQITKKHPLAGTGKSSILHLITREAADQERQGLDKEITKLKGDLEEVMKRLSLKDKEIEELKQTEKEIRFELKAEIDRAAALAKQAPRHPQSTPRSGFPAEDPKHREAIKLYEDLTNIIVLNIRSSPGQLKKDEWLFNCCYTHTNESDAVNATTYSISFSLRSYDEESDGVHTDWIQYLPMQLEQESPDFVSRLDFLNSAFQFERNQLALFLRTLYTTIEDIVKSGREMEDDEDDEIVVE